MLLLYPIQLTISFTVSVDDFLSAAMPDVMPLVVGRGYSDDNPQQTPPKHSVRNRDKKRTKIGMALISP